ncbi:LysR family transcriptional regulator [Rhizobium leguminosarum]|uniref:HTH-type transcriptional regulator TtuA n=1 Tax=Rhizobium leguminosarum TaxID=384 RepID=A0A4Q8Y0N6_RHILE|nr:LysR family transcriptional regulator [Rhizobium leguminosarum]TAV82294.1 LysR family transcriptional regulator [Rhizobium leguminosarum]TAV86144.1 LysR family transcriptional regulator [Rhizobium leguminosarum]TAW27352.1 LysR family transcriptional regulator [Rhizobium leguminosarum]TAX25704.1 LysR family transcriptional regulator [Rhizobium leguminosarum]TAX69186.1 LysR family transcriptional regulator [Rhizobium leguminosarum]
MFDGRLLNGVSVLAAVIESGSFARAAELMGLSASGVSRAISRLEGRIGLRLLDRTTRSMRLTDDGARFYEQVAPLLSGIEEAAQTAVGARQAVRGRLRVNVDPYFSRLVLGPRLGAFLDRYPDIQIEIITRNEIGDLVADGMDVAVRFGEPAQRSLISRLLMQTRVITIAAPAYIDRHGRPSRPQDLSEHTCIQFQDPLTARPFEWELRQGEKVVSIETRSRILVNDAGTTLATCLAGIGIAQVFSLGMADYLNNGQLVNLFPDWSDETFPLYAFYPSRQHVPAKVRAFIDFCVEIIE